uniref:Uncharacterized protein n=1 Tax=viral metagenome TaxID=1070528 RepID=A0A6H1ZCA0_9ZZZZ
MKWLRNIENILAVLAIVFCLYMDKSAWCLLLILIPVLNMFKNVVEE